jgi:hypothetical protein
VELTVPLPAGTRARELHVVLQPRRVRVARVGEALPMIDAELCRPIYVGQGVDDNCSSWELVDSVALVLHLSKWHRRERGNCRDASETWWPTCLQGEALCELAQPPVEYYALQ